MSLCIIGRNTSVRKRGGKVYNGRGGAGGGRGAARCCKSSQTLTLQFRSCQSQRMTAGLYSAAFWRVCQCVLFNVVTEPEGKHFRSNSNVLTTGTF